MGASVIKSNPCTNCGSHNHTSSNCFQKPRAVPRRLSNKNAKRNSRMRKEWFSRPENQPDMNQQWTCYLRIAPDCEIFVTRETLNLEHVKSKVRRKDLRFDPDNIKPACQPCNKLKGSQDLEDLVDKYPHLQKIIDTMVGR